MDNDLVENDHWLKRNWKWAVPATVLLLFIAGFLQSSNSKESIGAIAQAYTDNSLYEKAILIANTDKRTLETIGTIQAIDKLAILEGSVMYTNHNNSVALTVRITGTKADAKLDISADKVGSQWTYKKIVIRTKRPNKEIVVVNGFK
jgi:hypothetical protein